MTDLSKDFLKCAHEFVRDPKPFSKDSLTDSLNTSKRLVRVSELFLSFPSGIPDDFLSLRHGFLKLLMVLLTKLNKGADLQAVLLLQNRFQQVTAAD